MERRPHWRSDQGNYDKCHAESWFDRDLLMFFD